MREVASLAVVALQMAGSAGPVVDRYIANPDWRLHDIPWRAALRLEREQDYLARQIGDFANDALLTDFTPAGAKILTMAPVHQAYLQREVLVYWQSAVADRMVEDLAFALRSSGSAAAHSWWTWPAACWGARRWSWTRER